MRRTNGAGTIAALALTCVFGATLLLSMAAGASVYRRVADRVESAASRVGMTYITARIHGADQAQSVLGGQFAGQDALYLLQEYEGITYETILYVYDGWLREMFCEQGWETEPEGGQTIIEAQSLAVSSPEEGLLRLTYTGANGSSETADIYLRSEG